MLPTRTATATHIMVSTLKEFGMDVTVGEGKTAIIMTPRGHSAVQVKRDFFHTTKASILVLFEDQPLSLPLVPAYRHLGGQVTWASDLLTEMRSRAVKAKAAYWRAAKTVFRSKFLPLSTRLRLFQACVMSIWYWGCGSWCFEPEGTEVLCLNDLAHKPESGDFWTHTDIKLALEVTSPLDYLHEARLRHLGSLIRFGPGELWSLVLSDPRMREPLNTALDWCWQALQGDCELPPPADWQPWQHLIKTNPSRWKHLIALASLRRKRHSLRLLQTAKWYAEFYEVFKSHELLMPDEFCVRSVFPPEKDGFCTPTSCTNIKRPLAGLWQEIPV